MNPLSECLSEVPSETSSSSHMRLPWAHTEGLPLPLGVTWIEEDQAFNFAVCAEHAESVKLSLYSPTDLAKPVLTFRFDPIRIKSGRIWHCRIALNKMCKAGYNVTRFRGRPLLGSAA